MRIKAIYRNALWRFGERLSAQLISFAISVVLARILAPADFGIIVMTQVIIAICNVFVTSGFGNALVQKQRADSLDFSTILIFGLFVSTALYLILFVCANAVAEFYHEAALVAVLRVMLLKIPLAAVNSVQQAYVQRSMLFRKLFFSTLLSSAFSAVIGIYMAYSGFGVWALVGQYMAGAILETLLLGVFIGRIPRLAFSFERLRGMSGFGGRILLSDLINAVYMEMRSILIGRHYTAEQLAFYNQGTRLPDLFVKNASIAVSSVLFPVMAQQQNEKGQIKIIAKKTIVLSTYIVFPLMMGLGLVAKPLVSILLTDKWLPIVAFIQMQCFCSAVEPWSAANLQTLKARGNVQAYLRLEILKKSIAAAILISSFSLGVYGLAGSACVYSLIAVCLTASKNKENIDYSLAEQIKDILPNLYLTAAMAIAVAAVSMLRISTPAALALQIGTGIAAYSLLSAFTRADGYVLVKAILKQLKAQ